jgi:hypothetical protein
MFSERLTRPSRGQLLLVLLVGLALAVALSMALASNAEAKRKVQSTPVFCNVRTFALCTSTINPFTPGARHFNARSGAPETNRATFIRVEDSRKFLNCRFLGVTVGGGRVADQYFCKTTKKHRRHRWPDPIFCTTRYESALTDSSSFLSSSSSALASSHDAPNSAGVR